MSQRGNVVFYDTVKTINDHQTYSMSLVGEQSLLIDTDGRVSAGYHSGESNQGDSSIAVGYYAGSNNQASQSVAIGSGAGNTGQGINCVGVGSNAGGINQGRQSVAIGASAGITNQGIRSVAIGFEAGGLTQGSSAIAIGYRSGIEECNDGDVIIGTEMNAVPGQAPSLYVKPVRTVASSTGVLSYNNSTCEIAQTLNPQLNSLNVNGTLSANTVVVTGQLRNVQSTSRPPRVTAPDGTTIALGNLPYIYISDGNTHTVTANPLGDRIFGDRVLLQVDGFDGADTVLNFTDGSIVPPFSHEGGGAIYTFFYDGVHMVRIGTGTY